MWAPLAAIQSILGLTRTCPNCGNSQVVKSDDKHNAVKCNRCGTKIPPKKH